MEEEIQKSSKQKLYMNFIKVLANSYFLLVLILGGIQLVKSHGGNITTILLYVMGDTSIATQAFIYTSIFDAIFIISAISGSVFLLVLFNIKYKKVVIVFICIQSLTTISYIIRGITLIKGVVHMVTQGEIKNTNFSDMQAIFSRYMESEEFVVITLILLIGAILLPWVINKYIKYEARKEEISCGKC